MVYYNRKRITTLNPDGLLPSIYRERFEALSLVAWKLGGFFDGTNLTLNFVQDFKENLFVNPIELLQIWQKKGENNEDYLKIRKITDNQKKE